MSVFHPGDDLRIEAFQPLIMEASMKRSLIRKSAYLLLVLSSFIVAGASPATCHVPVVRVVPVSGGAASGTILSYCGCHGPSYQGEHRPASACASGYRHEVACSDYPTCGGYTYPTVLVCS